MSMNKAIIYAVGAIFLLGVLFRIFFALLYPDKFAEGANKVLFLEDREKKLFRPEKKQKESEKSPSQ